MDNKHDTGYAFTMIKQTPKKQCIYVVGNNCASLYQPQTRMDRVDVVPSI